MTIEEKAAAFDVVMEILNDRISLEKHYRSLGDDDTQRMNFLRANAYGEIVVNILGPGTLPNLPL